MEKEIISELKNRIEEFLTCRNHQNENNGKIANDEDTTRDAFARCACPSAKEVKR